MIKNETLMSRIALAFESSAKRFDFENRRLADLSLSETVENPDPRFEIADKVWVDYAANADVQLEVGPGSDGKGLRLHLTDIGQSGWFSFSYEIGISALRTSRYLGILTACSSNGIAAFRPCLRYILDDGFSDQFLPDVFMMTGGTDEHLGFLRPDITLLEQAKRAEILFFFEGDAFDITLLGVENLHV
ncbi:MAG: hypothetical protein KUG62_11695 [Rhodobacteraceae bacterium]|nr:hypothetical protein [Paracoccaceae bacterium]